MKRSLLIIFTAILLIITAGCSLDRLNESSVADNQYEQFVQTFQEFKHTFRDTDFQFLSPQELTVLTSSLPENQLDTRRTDTIGENVEFPTRFELYYLDEMSNVLIKLHFIYSPENRSTGFITVHGIDNSSNTNLQEPYTSMQRPQFYEMIASFGGYLVLLNYFDLNSPEKELDRDAFADIVVSFYQKVEQALLPNKP